jgi:hypothetical protein
MVEDREVGALTSIFILHDVQIIPGGFGAPKARPRQLVGRTLVFEATVF